MIKHVMTVGWSDQVTPSEVLDVTAQLRALPAEIDVLISLYVGSDLRLRSGNADFAIVATFANAEALEVYRTHPAHVPVASRLRKMAATYASVQINA